MDLKWEIIFADFADIDDVNEGLRYFIRVLFAVILGGIVGLERELKNKPAGLRTHILVALGSAVFIIVSLRAGMALADVSRVIQGIATGIGFIGAGAIIKMNEASQVKGLTTAASIWLTTAIGTAAGLGKLTTATAAAILAVIILAVLARVERRMSSESGD